MARWIHIAGALITLLGLFPAADLPAQGPPPRGDWAIALGGGGFVSPSYPGADQYRILPLPLVKVAYRERAFLGPSTAGGLGAAIGGYLVRTPQTGISLEVGLLENRPASRSDALTGLDDRDLVATVGAGVSHRVGPFEGTIGVIRGLDDGAGFLGTGGIAYTRPFSRRVIATIGIGAAFADSRQMRREFGVTGPEAERRADLIAAGDPRLGPDDGVAYQPGAGLRHVGGSFTLIYVLGSQWSLLGIGGVEVLGGEAAGSPIVRRRVQPSGALGLVWQP